MKLTATQISACRTVRDELSAALSAPHPADCARCEYALGEIRKAHGVVSMAGLKRLRILAREECVRITHSMIRDLDRMIATGMVQS